ncbi:hypothetical protein Pelo_7979 [Pelomyxa schiedti]|nr:hypothetical protein Pelo_7979 [Pelomyxa schiedti]
MGKKLDVLKEVVAAIIGVGGCYGGRLAIYIILTFNIYVYNWANLLYDQEATYELIEHNSFVPPLSDDCYAWSDVHCNSTDFILEQKDAYNTVTLTGLYSVVLLCVMCLLVAICMVLDLYLILKPPEPIFINGISSLGVPTQALEVLKTLKREGVSIRRIVILVLMFIFCAIPLASIGVLWYILVHESFQIDILNISGIYPDHCVCVYAYKDDWGKSQFLNSVTGSLMLSWCFLCSCLCWATGTIYSKTSFMACVRPPIFLQVITRPPIKIGSGATTAPPTEDTPLTGQI